MTLFTEHEPVVRSKRRGVRIGWLLLIVAIVAAVILALTPSPYVIEQPGPVFDTLGSAENGNGDDVPLISIPTEQTYPTEGTLDMLTVSILGNPKNLPNWAEVAGAWFDPSKAVLPVEAVFPRGATTEQIDEQNRVEMENSKQDAIAAALTQLGYDFTSTLTVAALTANSPSDGLLQSGDDILSLNGMALHDVSSLREAVTRNGTDVPAKVGIRRGGVDSIVEVTPAISGTGKNAVPVLGVLVGSDYSFPFDVKIQLSNVGGPSAGMMFALGIIDKLTPGALNGGKRVAGTGTITASGNVGVIGGIRQKLYGAKNAGAQYFLAPNGNCDDVAGHVPDGLAVFAVKTLTDALAALKAISVGDTETLATCSSK